MGIDYLKFNYSGADDSISSIIVDLGGFEDSIRIPRTYIIAAQNYWEINEENTALLFILARAICLRKENNAATSTSGRAKKYKFSNASTFPYKFAEKLNAVLKLVPIEEVELYFAEAKVDDLDYFLNRSTAEQFAGYLKTEDHIYDIFPDEY